MNSGEKREKDPLWQDFGKNKGKNTVKHYFYRAFVRIRTKIEKKTPSVAWLWLGLGQKKRKQPFWRSFGNEIRAKVMKKKNLFGRAVVRIRAKIETFLRIRAKIQ